jgi:cell volume regulation protein A
LISEVFVIVGGIIFIGFMADIVFERIKISNLIILMLLGFLLGPILGIADVSEGGIIKGIYPIVGALAFIIILFDAGTKTNLNRLIKTAPRATLFTIIVFVMTVLMTTAVLHFIFMWELLYALLLSAVVGGISSPIVISLVKKLDVSDIVKDTLTYESTLTDVLCVLTSVIIIEIIIESGAVIGVNDVFSFFVSTFSVSIVLGAVAGIGWIFALSKLPKHSFYYMLTMAMLFVLYAVTEYAEGNGAIAVFVFGLIIGHMRQFSKFIKFDDESIIDKRFLKFQDEVTFFVTTFFFVYIGFLLSPVHVNFYTAFFSLLILAVAMVARGIGKVLIYPDLSGNDELVINSMLPRGLAAAVLASLPAASGIYIQYFQEIVFMVILVSNLFPSIVIYLMSRQNCPKPNLPKKKEMKVLKKKSLAPGSKGSGKTKQNK